MGQRWRLALAVGLAVVIAATAWLLHEPADALDGTPVHGVLSRTDAPDASPTFEARAPETAAPMAIEPPAPDPLGIEPGDRADDVAPATLHLSVVYAGDAAPVAAAGVAVYWLPRSVFPPDVRQVETDESGLARLSFSGEGRLWKVEVRPGPGNAMKRESNNAQLGPGESLELQVVVGRGATLSGTVVSTLGAPLPNVEVRAWSRTRDGLERGLHSVGTAQPGIDPVLVPDLVASTDGNGRFTLRGLGPDLALTTRAEGMAARWDLTGQLAEGAQAAGVTLRMQPADVIRGRVVDEHSNPMAGVTVTAMYGWFGTGIETDVPGLFTAQPIHHAATTAPDGTFSLGTLVDGDWIVRASWRDWPKHSQRAKPGGAALELVLSPGLTLSGLVRGADSAPLPGARLALRGEAYANTFSGRDGRFRFESLPPLVDDVLAVVAPGHALQVIEGVKVMPAGDNELEIRLEPGRALAGLVVDAGGEPVAHAAIGIRGDRVIPRGNRFRGPWEAAVGMGHVQTDEKGRFRIDSLYDGLFELQVSPPGERDLHVALSARSGREDLLVRLDPVRMQGVVLHGRVTDAMTGAPVPDFDCIIARPDEDTGKVSPRGRVREFRATDGSYEIVGLEPGVLALCVRADGHAWWQDEARTHESGHYLVDVALPVARTLDLRVVDTERQPVADASLRFEDGAGAALTVRRGSRSLSHDLPTDDDGHVRASGLPAARLTVVVVVRSPRPSRLPLGETRFEFDLRAPLSGQQELVIETPHERWLLLAVVAADDASGWAGIDVRDEQGMLRIREAMADETISFVKADQRAVVRDASGAVYDTSVCSWSAEDGYSYRFGHETNHSGSPGLTVKLPEGPSEVELSADGCETVTLRIDPSDDIVQEFVVLQRSGGG